MKKMLEKAMELKKGLRLQEPGNIQLRFTETPKEPCHRTEKETQRKSSKRLQRSIKEEETHLSRRIKDYIGKRDVGPAETAEGKMIGDRKTNSRG